MRAEYKRTAESQGAPQPEKSIEELTLGVLVAIYGKDKVKSALLPR